MTSPKETLSTPELIRAAIAEVDFEVRKFSYPLFAVDKMLRPELFATSVLLECDGHVVLLTAAHAIHEIQASESTPHVGSLAGIFPVVDFVMSSATGSDVLDVAAMIIPPELTSRFRSPLPLSGTMIVRNSANPQMNLIHGFPLTKNKSYDSVKEADGIFKIEQLTYIGSSNVLDQEYLKYKKNTSFHSALRYQKQGRNERGNVVKPPDPKGISGGGMWIVPDIHNARHILLSGIAIEHHKTGPLIFATKIEFAIAFIRNYVIPSH
jgi:hypothetical protein